MQYNGNDARVGNKEIMENTEHGNASGCADTRVQSKASSQQQREALHDIEPVCQKDARMKDRNEGLVDKFTVLLGNVNSISSDQSENITGEGLEDMNRSNWHIKILPDHHKIHIL